MTQIFSFFGLALGALTASLTASAQTTGLIIPSFGDATPSTNLFAQAIDHTASPKSTFNQLVYVSSHFAETKSSAILLYLCAESPCAVRSVTNFEHYASQIQGGAYVVAIEHRYFGQSRPFADMSTEHLKYLTIEQATEDYADLIKSLRGQGLTGNVVSIGGSYGGIFSSALHQKHPELVAGSWNSSPALHFQFVTTSYDKVFENTVGTDCADSLNATLENFEKLVAKDPHDPTLAKIPDADKIADPNDLLFGLTDVAAAAVQYGHNDWLCNTVTKDGNTDKFIQFLQQMNTQVQYTVNSYTIETAMNANLPVGDNSDMRAYFYEECSEMGLFQGAFKNDLVRAAVLKKKYFQNACTRMFGAGEIEPRIAAAREKYFYPILNGRVANALYVSGTADPYISAGIAKDKVKKWPKNLVVLEIEGASHTEDFIGWRPADQNNAPMQAAEAQIGKCLNAWAKGDGESCSP